MSEPTPATAAGPAPIPAPSPWSVTHAERILDPASGTTKGMLAAWYEAAAPRLLRWLDGRALTVVRAPAGLAGERFFQRHEHALADADERRGDPIRIGSAEALAKAVQFGCVEFHVPVAREGRAPDMIVLDLDPDPALAWSGIVEAARACRALLESLGLAPFVKVSGSKGLHLVAPLSGDLPAGEVEALARAVAARLARDEPRRFVAQSAKDERVGRIFVDWLRNATGGTTVAPWSARLRPGFPVSVPLAWEALDELGSAAAFGLADAPARSAGADAWAQWSAAERSGAEAARRLATAGG